MPKLPILNVGDKVEIIAPASGCPDIHLTHMQKLLNSWGLHCIIDENIFGPDLLCANTDQMRFKLLKKALYNPTTKAVICARGGYGSMRLIPELLKISPPPFQKIFVGMSDITALNLYLQQKWKWPTIHGSLSIDKFSPDSIAALKQLLLGNSKKIEFRGLPLNSLAKNNQSMMARIVGGNLCLVHTSIGTSWQIDGRKKIILLEEVNERGYKIDRMLEHLTQAGVFTHAKAILLGDFTKGEETDGSSLVQSVLERFSQQCPIPVVQIHGIGHDYTNFPLPLGTKTKLELGEEIRITCSR